MQEQFFIVAFLILLIGLFGAIFSKNNMLYLLLSLELLLLASSIIFVMSSCFLHDIRGQVFNLFLLTIAASESIIGLTLLVIYYKLRGLTSINMLVLLKG